jgi:hypothetical protein
MNTKHFATAATAAMLIAATGARAAEPDFSPERFRAHVAYLSDDLLEGREAGTRGHELAARYIATQFDQMGLKPGGENDGWYQQVGLADVALTGAKPTVTVTTAKGAKAFEHGVSLLAAGPAAGGQVDISGEAVFVGYGMTDAAAGVDDYKGLEVRGKIVVVLRGIPKGMDSEIAAHLLSEQIRIAVDHGAIGVVKIRDLARVKAFPWKDMLQRTNDPETTWVGKDGVPFDPAYGLKASALVEGEPATLLFDGAGHSLAQVLAQADKGLRPKGFALKTKVELKVETKLRLYSSPEVIGRIEGSDPKLKGEYVVVMGHADHLGIKPEKAGDNIYNGALDNAAGIATLLEVAHAFTVSEPPRRSVLIIANTAEEKGLLGAAFFARYPTVPVDTIIAGVDLDMPLLTFDFTDVVAYGADHSTLSDAYRRAGATMGVKLTPDANPDQASFVRSDHYALVKVGIPAVLLGMGVENGGEKASHRHDIDHRRDPRPDEPGVVVEPRPRRPDPAAAGSPAAFRKPGRLGATPITKAATAARFQPLK